MKAYPIPGLAAAVIRDGVVVYKRTLGFADVEHGIRVTPSTPFQLASTTKTFGSTGILLLAGDDRLKLDTPIGDLLKDLPQSWRPVTVRQLLSHTSGLPDIVRAPGQLDLIASSWDEAFGLVATAPHQFAAGRKWSYNQTNYALLQRIIERLSGKPIEIFLQERLFQPLGMKETFYPSPAAPQRVCASNYEGAAGSETTPRAFDFPQFVHAAGGLCSSLDDLIRWNLALDADRVLRPGLASAAWTTTLLADGSPARIAGNRGYGLGWVVDDTPGHKAVGHSGGNSTAYRRLIDDRTTVIVLHNGVFDPDAIINAIDAILQREAGESGPGAQERLWDASMSGDTAAITRALDDGADIEKMDTRQSRNGRRALNWAAFNDRPSAIRVLVQRGAAIDATNKTGFTALHHAAEAGATDCVEALLAAGANPALVNAAGERPADIARRKGHADVAALIERSLRK